jgi:Zn-dependent M28 family amino/carboxypeptidase
MNRHRKRQRKRHRRRRRIAIAAIAGFSAVTLLLTLVTAIGLLDLSEPPPPQDLGAYAHLEAFQALADEHGDRAAGTAGYEAAAEYVEQQLESAGYRTSRRYFTVERSGEEFETFSVIAETAGGSADNVIMLGAHLDGVLDSAAINDNASGVAALLVAAEQLSERDEPTNKVRFAWWGAEEFRGTPGSRSYVEDLAENDGDELDNIAAYLNFDMVASPNHVIGVYDAQESNGDSENDVPDGSLEVMEFFTDYFDARDQPWVPVSWDIVSDQVAFTEEAVAVGGLFTGSSERKTARQADLFGGAADRPRDPNYHTSGDDISNVDREVLAIMTDAITHAAISLSEDSSALG